jgi:hypothetical protein|tara:strand:+ start:13312 stop:14526 length:1215 start_codon:yes stop_codon:yes gene_type:complete
MISVKNYDKESKFSNSTLLKAARFVAHVCIISLVWTNTVLAEQSLAELKLEAIKQRLVDLALQTDVRLGSSAYLDSDGVLHETAVMSSNADIRGVRILAYLEEAGIGTASVDAKLFSSVECPGSRPNIRRQASVRILVDQSYSDTDYRAGDHYVSELLTHSQQALLELLAGSQDWQSSVDVNYQSSYEKYMSSRAIDHANYRFDIKIHEKANPDFTRSDLLAGFDAAYDFLVWANPHLPSVELSQSWPKQLLEYELSLVDRRSEMPLWKDSLVFHYPSVARGYGKNTLPLPVKRQIAAINKRFVQDVTEALDCQTEHYPLNVVFGRHDRFKIYAGLLAGVNVGDQFLISANANILTQSLSMSGLAELGLAEVESISGRAAILRHTAGPQPKGLGVISNSVAIHF